MPRYGFEPLGKESRPLKPMNIRDLNRKVTPKTLRTSVTLPSQYQSYAICVEFAKHWFVSKFKPNFFNSIYVNGTHTFDEFRKFSTINDRLKKTNPLLAIVPTIDMTHNRSWVDTAPEIPMLLRRSRIEGTFFNDVEKGLHLQLIFKTILMNFNFQIRVNTRAEELDMVEFIKLRHRAGWTESQDIDLDVHVPKQIMRQIAFDIGIPIDDDTGTITQPMVLVEYINKHSYLPCVYKLRCATGNDEFFLRVPNCVAHIKSEMPTFDDGVRDDMTTSDYTIDFNVEIEMTAPYCYTYFSQKEQPYIIRTEPTCKNYDKIAVMAAMQTVIPKMNCKGWNQYTISEYDIDDEDLGKCIEMDFNELFSGSDIMKIIDYTKRMSISPAIFLDFKIFNDGRELDYDIDWNTLKCQTKFPAVNNRFPIGIYCDMEYINNTLIYLKQLDSGDASVPRFEQTRPLGE